MDTRALAIVDVLRKHISVRDAPFILSYGNGGQVLVQGPRRVSARGLAAECAKQGKTFSIKYSAPVGDAPEIIISDNKNWNAAVAPPVSGSNQATVIMWSSNLGLQATTSTLPRRESGSVDVIKVVATGEASCQIGPTPCIAL
jgi:hypothetical protein